MSDLDQFKDFLRIMFWMGVALFIVLLAWFIVSALVVPGVQP